MKKNVASQAIGAQMVSATDGSAFTGSVTVYVTGDAGTQSAGSVGSGACTHEGNGYHTYAPAQAETNYDLVAFTFTGTGAVPATIQVYTDFPQTGDTYALANGASGFVAIAGYIDTEVGTIVTQTGASAIRTAVGLASANLDTQLSTIAGYIDTEVGAIKAKTDNLPASPAAVSDIPTAIQNADALLNRDMSTGTDSGSTTVRTVRQALRAIRNKIAIATGTLTVYKEDDATASWTAAVSTDAAADPITAVDPAGP